MHRKVDLRKHNIVQVGQSDATWDQFYKCEPCCKFFSGVRYGNDWSRGVLHTLHNHCLETEHKMNCTLRQQAVQPVEWRRFRSFAADIPAEHMPYFVVKKSAGPPANTRREGISAATFSFGCKLCNRIVVDYATEGMIFYLIEMVFLHCYDPVHVQYFTINAEHGYLVERDTKRFVEWTPLSQFRFPSKLAKMGQQAIEETERSKTARPADNFLGKEEPICISSDDDNDDDDGAQNGNGGHRRTCGKGRNGAVDDSGIRDRSPQHIGRIRWVRSGLQDNGRLSPVGQSAGALQPQTSSVVSSTHAGLSSSFAQLPGPFSGTLPFGGPQQENPSSFDSAASLPSANFDPPSFLNTSLTDAGLSFQTQLQTQLDSTTDFQYSQPADQHDFMPSNSTTLDFRPSNDGGFMSTSSTLPDFDEGCLSQSRLTDERGFSSDEHRYSLPKTTGNSRFSSLVPIPKRHFSPPQPNDSSRFRLIDPADERRFSPLQSAHELRFSPPRSANEDRFPSPVDERRFHSPTRKRRFSSQRSTTERLPSPFHSTSDSRFSPYDDNDDYVSSSMSRQSLSEELSDVLSSKVSRMVRELDDLPLPTLDHSSPNVRHRSTSSKHNHRRDERRRQNDDSSKRWPESRDSRRRSGHHSSRNGRN